MGGLVARYAIGRLYEPVTTVEFSGGTDEESKVKDICMLGRIAGLEPMNFITFASPHLGSRGHRQVGYPLAYSKLFYWALPSTSQLTFSSSFYMYCILCVHICIGVNSAFQLPFLCGLPFLERSASETAHFIVGRTGKHLFLTDKDDGKLPLLLRMVDDCDDIKFRFDFCILSLCIVILKLQVSNF